MGWSTFRVPASSNDVRSIEEVAGQEWRIVASLIDAGDPALEVGLLFSVKRLTGAARERIERAECVEPD